MNAVPLFLIVSAPSGAGKTTLCDRLRAAHPEIRYSVSCTTRPPRAGERDGVDYTFLTESEFERRVGEKDFLEYARVHGHWYGTLRENMETCLMAGHDALMDIDVQGAAQIRDAIARRPETDVMRRAYVDVFIAPPSLDALRKRLIARGTDSPEAIERRLRQAGAEMKRASEYQYLVINGDLDRADAVLRAIFLAERHRTRRAAPRF